MIEFVAVYMLVDVYYAKLIILLNLSTLGLSALIIEDLLVSDLLIIRVHRDGEGGVRGV